MRLGSLAPFLALVLPGCCSMARLFCGPDRTPWVSIDYSTPQKAVRTFLEALRRDDPEVVYHATSGNFREHYGIDKATVQLAWPKIKEENPYLHVAGYADVPVPEQAGDRAHVELSIEGHRLAIELVRQKRCEVRYPLPNGALAEPGAYVTRFADRMTLSENDTGTKASLQLVPITFAKGPLVEIPIEELQFAGYVAEWKIDAVKPVADG